MRSVTKRFFSAREFTLLTVGIIGMSYALARQPQGSESDWSSMPLSSKRAVVRTLCPCNFNSVKPAAHSGHEGHGTAVEYFCRFNRAFKVNKGNFGATKLDGVKFWMAGDLGGDFSHDQADWGVLNFESSVTTD